MFTVYLIKSDSDSYYTGHTNNLERRLFEHNNRLCKTTKSSNNWKVIYSKKFSTRSEAMIYEKWLKSGKGREFLKSYKNSNEMA